MQYAGSLITIGQNVRGESLLTIEQSLGRSQSGSLVTIEQQVLSRVSFSGSLLTIEQGVINTFLGSLFVIEQSVISAAVISNLERYGWDLTLIIDGATIDHDLIHDQITVNRTENAASLMSVTLINKIGVINIAEFHGKDITLDAHTATGIRRIYTGTVDIPEFDLINKLITLRCTDKRNEQINNQLKIAVKSIGTWSEAIFEEPKDVTEELQNRLLTTPKVVDFDAYGNYTISDFLAKASPDFTLDDADIYRRKPTLSVASRARLVNRVNVDFGFRYVRLRHRKRNFELQGPDFCEVMSTAGLAFLSVEGIKSNLEAFGWSVDMGGLSFTYLRQGGRYNCGFGYFFWTPIVMTAQTATKKDGDGNPIKDSKNNPIIEVVNRVVTDYTKAFAENVSFNAVKQFAQDVTHTINIQVNAPQSQNQYGVIKQDQRNGLQKDFDTAEWEKNDIYKKAPDDFTATSTDSFKDISGTQTEFNNAINTVIDIAKNKILKSHRDNQVTLQVPLWPEIDLKHTVQTTAGLIQCKGKVSRIDHTFNLSTREANTGVQLSLSTATGSQVDGTLSITKPTAALIGDAYPGTFKMNTYKIPSGFSTGGVSNIARELGLITPAIDQQSRGKQESEQSHNLDISIRNDQLVVNYG